MKALSLQLDKLISNPSYEQVRGKLVLCSVGGNRLILELKSRKNISLLGPFSEDDYSHLVGKEIISFSKEGEPTHVYDVKQIPKADRAKTATKANRTARGGSKTAAPKPPLKKWVKFSEGRMVGEPVKIIDMEKGFGIDKELIFKMLAHLDIPHNDNSRDIAYLDFRKVYKFMISEEYAGFAS